MTFTRNGKQVLRDRQHFADAASEESAAEIVMVLNERSHLAQIARTELTGMKQIGGVQRAQSIIAFIQAEIPKRKSRGVRRLGEVLIDAIKHGFDLPQEAAPEGERARYHEEGAA